MEDGWTDGRINERKVGSYYINSVTLSGTLCGKEPLQVASAGSAPGKGSEVGPVSSGNATVPGGLTLAPAGGFCSSLGALTVPSPQTRRLLSVVSKCSQLCSLTDAADSAFSLSRVNVSPVIKRAMVLAHGV